MVHPTAQSPSTIRAAETLTPTYEVHLPSMYRNFPPVIQVPEGEYLLVEYWTHSLLGTNCEGLCIDFPTYSFDSQSGALTIDLPDPALVLADDEIGYIGSGESLGGVGCGAFSDLTKIREWQLWPAEDVVEWIEQPPPLASINDGNRARGYPVGHRFVGANSCRNAQSIST